MFRSIFAVVLGLAVLVGYPELLSFLGLTPDPGEPATSEANLIALAAGFAAAALGGAMTAFLAPHRRWKHIQVLVALFLLGAAVTLAWSRGPMPLGYDLASIVSTVVGVFVGASLKPGSRL